jgi:hypothetical protein
MVHFFVKIMYKVGILLCKYYLFDWMHDYVGFV